jgi:hypothetical protein
MNPQQAINNTLPADFDGTFRFTNWTDRDFTAKWGGVEYTFPALKTTPMVILSVTPYELQNIRKKFAKTLAEREFFQSKEHNRLDAMNKSENIRTFAAAVTYTPGNLEVLVQKCLEPLTPAPAPKPVVVPKVVEEPKTMKRIKSRQSGDNEDESLTQGNVIA